MAPVGPSFFTVPDRPPASGGDSRWAHRRLALGRARPFDRWSALCDTGGAIAVGRAEVIVDLSGMEFMGASTLGVIARARELLWQGSASLTVRSPSAFLRRLISVCGLDDLLGPNPEMAAAVTRKRSAPGWQCRQRAAR